MLFLPHKPLLLHLIFVLALLLLLTVPPPHHLSIRVQRLIQVDLFVLLGIRAGVEPLSALLAHVRPIAGVKPQVNYPLPPVLEHLGN